VVSNPFTLAVVMIGGVVTAALARVLVRRAAASGAGAAAAGRADAGWASCARMTIS